MESVSHSIAGDVLTVSSGWTQRAPSANARPNTFYGRLRSIASDWTLEFYGILY